MHAPRTSPQSRTVARAPCRSLGDAETRAVLAGPAARRRRAAGADRRRQSATSPSSAPASPACGRRCSPRSATRRRRRRPRGRRRRRPGQRPQRRHLHGLAHARLRHGRRALPRREAAARASSATENSRRHRATIGARAGIDCGWERTGELEIATAAWQVDGLREERGPLRARWASAAHVAGRDELRAEIHSPTYLAGLWHHDAAILDPARLAWGLARAARSVACASSSARRSRRSERVRRRRRAARAVGRAARPARRARHQRLPAAAPPAAAARRARLRLRAHDRAADARRSSSPSAGRAGRRWRTPATCSTTTGSPRTSASCGAAGTRSTTAAAASAGATRTGRTCSPSWPVTSSRPSRSSRGCASPTAGPGVIDTCSRFCQFWGTALDGRVSYVLGYTGLGVAASRFGARVALDLARAARTELTEMDFVRSRPLPFPPEPLLPPA